MNETNSSLPPPIPSSGQSPSTDHPFDRFRARFMILVWVALSIGLAIFVMIFLHNEGLDLRGADKKLAILLAGTVATLAMPLSAAIVSIPLGIRWDRLIGKLRKPSELFYGFGSGLPLAGGGIFFVYIYFGCLSTVAPGHVEDILNDDFSQLVWAGRHQALINRLIALNLVILAPVCEEIVFRGFLFTRWRRKWGPVRASLCVSVLFALMHPNILGAFVFSLAMCAMYIRFRSLIVPMLAHASNNLIALILMAAELHDADAGQFITLEEFFADWWWGAIGLLIFVPWVIRLLYLTPSLSQWTPPHAQDLKDAELDRN